MNIKTFVTEGPEPQKLRKKIDPKNSRHAAIFVDYCGVLPPGEVSITL